MHYKYSNLFVNNLEYFVYECPLKWTLVIYVTTENFVKSLMRLKQQHLPTLSSEIDTSLDKSLSVSRIFI